MIMIIFDDCTYELGAKSLIVGLLALLVGCLGFLMSILTLGIVWVIPAMKAQTPPYHPPKHRVPNHRHHIRPTFPQLTNRLVDSPLAIISKSPSLQRSTSFPELRLSPSALALQQSERPKAARHVSFNVGTNSPEGMRSSMASTTFSPLTSIQRRWPASVSPFCKRRLSGQAQSPTRTPRSSLSSEGSGTLVSPLLSPRHNSPSPMGKTASPGIHSLPLRCFDDHCECHSPTQTGVDEMGVLVDSGLPHGMTATRSSRSMSLSLSMRLPKMRNALSAKKRSPSVDVSIPVHGHDEVSPVSPSEPLASSSDIKAATTPTRTSSTRPGETYRAGFVSPLKRKKARAGSLSPMLDVPFKGEILSPVGFSNPWSPTRSSTMSSFDEARQPSPSSLIFDPPELNPGPSRRTLASRFAAFRGGSHRDSTPSSSPPSVPHTALHSPSGSPKSTTVALTNRGKTERKTVARTQPYGPPYNIPMPVRPSIVSEASTRAGSDPEVYARKRAGRIGRGTKLVGADAETESGEPKAAVIKAPTPKVPKGGSKGHYPPPNLVEVLDERLSALRTAEEVDVSPAVAESVLTEGKEHPATDRGNGGNGQPWTFPGLRDVIKWRALSDTWTLGLAT